MIKVGLCDDNDLHINELSKLLNNISLKKNLPLEIITFKSGEELINFHKNKGDYFDLIFLDILMDGINGIVTAKTLKSICSNTYIIFVTVSKDYALDSYEVDAYSYILKPFNEDKISSKFLSVVEKVLHNRKNILHVKNNQDMYSINLDSTIFFESNLRKITAYSISNEVSFYEKLSNLEVDLRCSNFIRCHRSYLVNLSYIKNIISSEVVTTTGHRIPISKKYLKSIREDFMEYIKNIL